MEFRGREIQGYELEMEFNEVYIDLVEIDDCDVLDKLLRSGLEDFTEELTEILTNNWHDFDKEQQQCLFESLTHHLKTFADSDYVEKYLGTKTKSEPRDYEVGMILRATRDYPYSIGVLSKGMTTKVSAYSESYGFEVDIGNGWVLPPFEEMEEYGFEVVGDGEDDTITATPLETFSDRELLDELRVRLERDQLKKSGG